MALVFSSKCYLTSCTDDMCSLSYHQLNQALKDILTKMLPVRVIYQHLAKLMGGEQLRLTITKKQQQKQTDTKGRTRLAHAAYHPHSFRAGTFWDQQVPTRPGQSKALCRARACPPADCWLSGACKHLANSERLWGCLPRTFSSQLQAKCCQRSEAFQCISNFTLQSWLMEVLKKPL